MMLAPSGNGVRITVPFTVKGSQYLLRILGEDGTVCWIGQREGGGVLSFDAVIAPLPDHPASYEAILTSDAKNFAPITTTLTWTPDAEAEAPPCPHDASCPLTRFSDLDPRSWYHDGIRMALERGTMNGYADGTFRPDSPTSRAMLVTMLWRMEGEPRVRYDTTFADVAEGAWYAEAVRWAVSSGIISGYDARTFGPDNGVTREQLAAILYRYAAIRGEAEFAEEMDPDPLGSFADAGQISPWALDAMRWAVGRGMINGVEGGSLLPLNHASRAQVAVVLARFSS